MGIAVLTPILLFMILTALLYLPPVQNWAVKKVASIASEKTGMTITVGHVNLAFPLDLGVDDFMAIKANDTMWVVGEYENLELLKLITNPPFTIKDGILDIK